MINAFCAVIKNQTNHSKNKKIQDCIIEILMIALLESIDLSLQFSMHMITLIRVRHISVSG